MPYARSKRPRSPAREVLALFAGLALGASALHAEPPPCDESNLVVEETSAPRLDLSVTQASANAVVCLRGENHTGDVRLYARAEGGPIGSAIPSNARVLVLGIAHADGAKIEIAGLQFVLIGGFPPEFLPPAGAFADTAVSVSTGRHLGDGDVFVSDHAGGAAAASSRAAASNQGVATVGAHSHAGALLGDADAHAIAAGGGSVFATATAAAAVGDAHARAEATGAAGFVRATAQGEAFPLSWPNSSAGARRLSASAQADVRSPVAVEASLGSGTLASRPSDVDAFLVAADAPSADALAPFLSNARVAGAFQSVDEVLAIAQAGFAPRGDEAAGPITLTAHLGVGVASASAPLATPIDGILVGFVAPGLAENGFESLRIRIGWVGRLVFDQTFVTSDALLAFLDGGVVHVTPTDGPLDFLVAPLPTFSNQVEMLSVRLDAVFDSPGGRLEFGVIVGANNVPEPALALLLAASFVLLRFARPEAARASPAPKDQT